MSEIIHSTKITKVGASAATFKEENMCIFFHEEVPPYLAEFCYLIEHGQGSYDVKIGDILQIGEASCPITAIGEVALVNYKNLGHLTVKFDGAAEPDLPGVIHVQHDGVPEMNAGDQVLFVKA